MSARRITKAILLPGNGVGDDDAMEEVMWYGTFAATLQEQLGIPCDLRNMPDPLYAREAIWKKFAVEELGLDESTLLVGHSSGSACALRLMEEHKVAGVLLVAAYDSDLGDELEKASGYFNRPFNWEQMRLNTPWVIQFHSEDDHLVPVACARRVAASLGEAVDYHESKRNGHFQLEEYEEFIEALRAKILTHKKD